MGDSSATLEPLTMTAGFVTESGYVEVERADAPAPIRQTTEFEDFVRTPRRV